MLSGLAERFGRYARLSFAVTTTDRARLLILLSASIERIQHQVGIFAGDFRALAVLRDGRTCESELDTLSFTPAFLSPVLRQRKRDFKHDRTLTPHPSSFLDTL